ncbi:hypothetical protein HY251_21705 [bacterium]|nr:hypothetical protein [bacterium]
MEDKVGSKIPKKPEVDEIVGLLKSAKSKVDKFGVDLSAEDRLHATKFRPGGAKIVRLVADLAKKHKVSFDGATPEGMLADLELMEAVEPILTAAKSAAQVVEDTSLEAGAECWFALGILYAGLKAASRTSKELASSLKPVQDFFKTLRKRGRETDAGPPAK